MWDACLLYHVHACHVHEPPPLSFNPPLLPPSPPLPPSEYRSSKSVSVQSSPPPQDEKDYFQVTDELSRENSHFSLSEALLAVIEQYKATYLEQQLLEEQLSPPPASPTSTLTPTPSLGYTPLSYSPSTLGARDTPFLSSWGSMSSIATNPDGK